ncbi:MAG: glycosyltransferase family 4 protein [Cyclobacteriaceae bacterium]
MKKIAMFLERDFPPDPRVENEALSLIEAGHNVYLFCITYDNEHLLVEEYKNIKVYRYSGNKLIYKLSALAYTFPFYRWLISSKIKHFIGAIQPDVLHVHDMVLAEAVMRVNKKRLPVLLDLHENRPAIMEYYNHTKKFPGNILINLKKWHSKQLELIYNSDKVIVVTQEAADHYVSLTNMNLGDFIVVPNTVNLESFRGFPIDRSILERFNAGFNLVYVGDTGLRRGTLTAIEAVYRLKDAIPNIQLILVGKSSQDYILKGRVKELGIEKHVFFEGWQDLSLFPSYIKAADICLSPILRNLHHDTTYANKIFQYMAMEKPVIVSDCPPQVRVIEESNCGLVFKADDEDDLTSKILYLNRNPEERLTMGKSGFETGRQKWNWAKSQKDLVHFYKQ